MGNLPSFIQEADIKEWEKVLPEGFIRKPYLKDEIPENYRADKVLKYSRSGSSDSYDEIAARLLVSTPYVESGRLTSVTSAKWEITLNKSLAKNVNLDYLILQRDYLIHRPLGMIQNGSHDFSSNNDFVKCSVTTADGQPSLSGNLVYPFKHLPEAFLADAVPDNPLPLLTQQGPIEAPGLYWLPLLTMIETGEFLRMQDWRDKLLGGTIPKALFCFISHRWLAPVHPDPNRIQAHDIAWQFVGYIIEAVQIAKDRSLDKPGLFSPLLARPVGVTGSPLAESIITNLLRTNLTQDLLNELLEEIPSLTALYNENEQSWIKNSYLLKELGAILEDKPILKSLIEKIFIWYDYSCMPQKPFSGDDEIIFRHNMERLHILQHIGQTVILLEDEVDYLSRAWCTFESAFAQNETNYKWITIEGSPSSNYKNINTNIRLSDLIYSRSHFIWRAILDTELFRIQDSLTCMKRLGLATTDPNDLPFIYERLKEFRMPVEISLDASEVVTGIFPLPVIDNSGMAMFAPSTVPVKLLKENKEPELLTLDWTGILSAKHSLEPFSEDITGFVDGFIQFPMPENKELYSCHIVVMGSCEGESIVISRWAATYKTDLEKLLKVNVQSLSWISSDINPVGQIVNGKLQPVCIACDVYVLLGCELRLNHCSTAGTIINTIMAAGKSFIKLMYDIREKNVSIFYAREHNDKLDFSSLKAVKVSAKFKTHTGGLYRWALPGKLTMRVVDNPVDLFNFLYQAVRDNKADSIKATCNEYQENIIDHFKTWMTVPAQLVSNKDVVSLWKRTLQYIAGYFEEIGRFEIGDILAGDKSTNAFIQIDNSLTEATVLYEQGKFEESNNLLKDILQRLPGGSGIPITALAMKAHGLKGINYLYMDNVDDAKYHIQKALEYSKVLNDQHSVRRYQKDMELLITYESLKSNEQTSLLKVRNEVVKAQKLSDNANYKGSNEVLQEIITLVEDSPDADVKAYQSKVYGLMGFNYFKINEIDLSKRYTELALALCKKYNDEFGTAIYEANQEFIVRNAAL